MNIMLPCTNLCNNTYISHIDISINHVERERYYYICGERERERERYRYMYTLYKYMRIYACMYVYMSIHILG